MNENLLKLLQRVDTPPLYAIEVAQGKRGFNASPVVLCLPPILMSCDGRLCTYRADRSSRPTNRGSEVIKARRMAYYRHMSEGPRPAVVVIEDMDFPHCIGAYWGEINTNVHKGFGMSGALTNGVMRDLGDLPDGFPVVAGSIGPSHGFVHVKEVGTTVTVFGMQVADGDLIHADRHGGVVIPSEVLDTLEVAILKLLDTEKLVLDPARKDGFDLDAFETAWTAFENART